jgi:hypothetical protein
VAQQRKLSRKATEVLRRHGRGDATLFELLQHFTPLELVRHSERRMRAARRCAQAKWLESVRDEMENRPCTLGLKREAWRGLWIDQVIRDEHGDPFESVGLAVESRPSPALKGLLGFLESKSPSEQANQAYWAAAGAWCADWASSCSNDSARQLLIGQYLAACRANLLFPSRVKSVHAINAKRDSPCGRTGQDRSRDQDHSATGA